MSFVLVSRTRKKDPDAPATTDDGREQEIQRRVQLELEQRQQAAMAAAQDAAESAARAALKPLEQQLQQAVSALKTANTQLVHPLAQKEQDLAELVVDMAFQLARHIVGAQVAQDRAPLLKLVTGLLDEAGAERTPQQTLTIRLHPGDLPFIKDHLAQTEASLVADPTLNPGDALVELVLKNSDLLDKTEWDARLESRLETVARALLPPGKGLE